MYFNKIACVGAGQIGQGWATIFSSKGIEVILHDTDESILERSMKAIISNLNFLEKHHLIERGEAGNALKRLQTTTDLKKSVADADYVQESVPDDYGVKQEVFRKIDMLAPETAILASSASGLLMTEIQRETKKPERCVMAHPILPVHLIPVVEIVGGEKTAEETVRATYDFMKQLGKIPVVLKREVPGYIINRLQAALLREAMDLVAKGIASAEDVDKAFCMGIGIRDPLIGPFLRIHLAGNGVENFIKNYSESYRYRWESMDTWTSISREMAETISEKTREIDLVRNKNLDEIKVWRDEMLIKILRAIDEG